MVKKSKTTQSSKQGNIYDTFVKEMFSQIYIVADFLVHYAKKEFVNTLDLSTLELVNTHFFDKTGREKIADLVFQCKRPGSDKDAMVVIVFKHTSSDSRSKYLQEKIKNLIRK